MAPRCANPRARPEGSGRRTARGARAPLRCTPASFRSAGSPARTARLRSALTAPLRRADRSGESALLEHPRAQTLRADALRLALLVAATARALRCAAIANRPLAALAVARRLARRGNQRRAARGSTRLAALVGDEHVLDGPENLLLAVARERAHALKDGLRFADRPGAAF